jgi:hypothetical protein
MTTTNKFFETKDQYLAFRAAFAAAQSNPRAKKGKADSVGFKQPGWLSAAHFMLLNQARGLPRLRGFTEITSRVKLDNGMPADLHITYASRTLDRMIADAKAFAETKPYEPNSWETKGKSKEAIDKLIEEKTVAKRKALHDRLQAFLEPFAGAFTIADLARMGE